MYVELRPHVGFNLITKREQCFEQYLIFHGHPDKMKLVGLIGWKEGSKIVYLKPVDPISKRSIEEEVSKQLERDAEAIDCPDLTEDQIHPPQENPFDEFNESDLT